MKNSLLSLAILGGLIAVGSAQAQAPRSGVGNDRTGDTMNNSDMRTSGTAVIGGSAVSYSAPNDDIKPMNTTTGAPTSNNTYGTVHSNNKNEVKHGM